MEDNSAQKATAKHGGELKIDDRKKHMQDYQSVHLYDPETSVEWSCCEILIMFGAWLLMIIPIFWFYMFRTVRDYERALIFRLGKLKGGAEGPGVFLINPLTDKIYVVDLRIETYNLPPQGMCKYITQYCHYILAQCICRYDDKGCSDCYC